MLAVAAIIVAGCGRGYEAENRSLVELLPTPDGVTLLDEDYSEYCREDTCWLGGDRSAALLTYSVDTTAQSQQTMIDVYHNHLADWDLETFTGPCGQGDDPLLCDQIISAYLVRGDEEIGLNLDNWSVGRFEISVDARGGERDH